MVLILFHGVALRWVLVGECGRVRLGSSERQRERGGALRTLTIASKKKMREKAYTIAKNMSQNSSSRNFRKSSNASNTPYAEDCP